MTNIGVLDTDKLSPEAARKFGDTGQLFVDYFASYPDLVLEKIPVAKTGTVPDFAGYDGFIITGSSHGVYDDLPWLAPLKNLVRRATEKSIPVLGICFGHQLMAEAFGGRVEKSPKGWGVGIHEHALNADGCRVFDGLSDIRIMAAHQDQVVAAPQGGTLLASSAFCPNAAFAYGKHGLSVQGHPEISPDYERYIISKIQDAGLMAAGVAQSGLRSLDEVKTNTDLLKPYLARFLSGTL